MMNQTEIQKLLSIIDSCLKGAGDESMVNKVWEKYDKDFVKDSLLGDTWSELTHFIDDADIKEKDPEYAGYQKDKLQKYLEEI